MIVLSKSARIFYDIKNLRAKPESYYMKVCVNKNEKFSDCIYCNDKKLWIRENFKFICNIENLIPNGKGIKP